MVVTMAKPVKATASIKTLEAVLDKPIDKRLEALKTTIPSVEQGLVKNTDELARKLITVLTSITRDPSATSDQLAAAAKYRMRVSAFDPRKTEKEVEADALAAACSRTDDIDAGDEAVSNTGDIWDAPPPLPTEETLRLVELQRPYSIYVAGAFVLRPGADVKTMIESALDGREFGVPTLLKLHRHLKESFSAGGIALAGGPLFSELQRILNERGALQPPPPKAPDGFELGFLNAIDVVARIRLKYGDSQPKWTDLENERLLQTALGETPLSEHSIRQLWLSLAHDFFDRLGCDEASLTPQTKWVTAAICSYANHHAVSIPTPGCLNVTEELAFRA